MRSYLPLAVFGALVLILVALVCNLGHCQPPTVNNYQSGEELTVPPILVAPAPGPANVVRRFMGWPMLMCPVRVYVIQPAPLAPVGIQPLVYQPLVGGGP
jgi:hypothetical protein